MFAGGGAAVSAKTYQYRPGGGDDSSKASGSQYMFITMYITPGPDDPEPHSMNANTRLCVAQLASGTCALTGALWSRPLAHAKTDMTGLTVDRMTL